MKSICVFCGSSHGTSPRYAEAATVLGETIARKGHTLVYGGASVGLMGVVADAALRAGGRVVGVLPAFMMGREIAHAGLSELVVVDSMHERKAQMAERADAFVALPGGLGTLEEIFEVLTWRQLGLHKKPCALLDVGGFYAQLTEFLNHAETEGFVRAPHRASILVESDPATLVTRLSAAFESENASPVDVAKT